MRSIICILIVLGSASHAGAQAKKRLYQDQQVKIEYTVRNGLLDGKYISYYASGKKKAEGSYKNNLRTGKWFVWDSAGTKIEHVVKPDTTARTGEGYHAYYFLREQDVYMESRIWRDIFKESNPLLFSNASFADTLIQWVLRDSVQLYYDEDFLSPIPHERITKLNTEDTYEVVQYKLKEDWFINRSRGVTSFRPLGICPVLIPRNAARGESVYLGWLYFPQIRGLLATQKVQDKTKPVLHLDDLFWYRQFSSVIYKQTNLYDKPVAELVKGEAQAMREAERIALSLIEWEHYYWLHPLKRPFNYMHEH